MDPNEADVLYLSNSDLRRRRQHMADVLAAVSRVPPAVATVVAPWLVGFGAKVAHFHSAAETSCDGRLPAAYLAVREGRRFLAVPKEARRWADRSTSAMRETLWTRGLVPHGPGEGIEWDAEGGEPACPADLLAVAMHRPADVARTEAVLREVLGPDVRWAPVFGSWNDARLAVGVGLNRDLVARMPARWGRDDGDYAALSVATHPVWGRGASVSRGGLPTHLRPVLAALWELPMRVLLAKGSGGFRVVLPRGCA